MENNIIIYSVSEISSLVEKTVSQQFTKPISVQGEISNVKMFRGNVYMTIKDTYSSLKVVMWAYDKNKNRPKLKDGFQVIITGIIKVYTKSSYYQINAYDIELFGIGDLHQHYLNIKQKYDNLGYFNSKNKKKFPSKIESVGIVTSVDGAALKDILYVMEKNNFSGKVFVKGCYVQGTNCPKSIVKGIKYFNDFREDGKKIDVIVISRGGGSLEDLFGFSHETVIEEIHKSKICIVSAVGHEIDNMLSDFVADIRAPTPSVAGELITIHQNNILNELHELDMYITCNLYSNINSLLYSFQNSLMNCKKKLFSPSDLIKKKENDVNYFKDFFEIIIFNKYNNIYLVLNNIKHKLILLDPKLILQKGYSIIMDSDRNIIESIDNLRENDEVIIKMLDGEYKIKLKQVNFIKNKI